MKYLGVKCRFYTLLSSGSKRKVTCTFLDVYPCGMCTYEANMPNLSW